MSSIVGKDAVKYFGIYCQHSSYKFYHQGSAVFALIVCTLMVFIIFFFFWNGQDGKIDA